MKILCVNRSATSRKLISCTLGRLGHSVIDAASCQDAIAVLDREHFDGIILDLGSMITEADSGSTALFGELSKNTLSASVPLVALVEKSDPLSRYAAQSLGASGIVEKPFPEENLVIAVNRCFSQARPGQRKIV